jgi:signal transduction histidine kinase
MARASRAGSASDTRHRAHLASTRDPLEPPRHDQRQQARLALLSRIAGSLSHEICNPLNAIFLHTDVLEEELHQLTPGNRAQIEARWRRSRPSSHACTA